MSKFLTLIFVSFTFIINAQDSTKLDFQPYIAAGLSMTNSDDFKSNSYPSVEFGFMVNNITLASVFGRNDLTGGKETIDNYWYEGKIGFSFPLGFVSGYGVFGVGSYIGGPGTLFIEYGGGISKEFGKLGTFLQVSSWDGVTYVTPGLSYSL